MTIKLASSILSIVNQKILACKLPNCKFLQSRVTQKQPGHKEISEEEAALAYATLESAQTHPQGEESQQQRGMREHATKTRSHTSL